MVGKIYGAILVDTSYRMTEGLIGDEQGGFRAGRGCIDQIFTLKHISEKDREKKCWVFMGFIDLGKGYDRVNREAIWQLLRMYDMGDKLLNQLTVCKLII